MTLRFLFLALFIVSVSHAHAQITLTKSSDMFFGEVEYTPTHNGTVRLGTNGGLSVTGTGFVVTGIGIPGQVEITATPADVVEVKCDNTGRMSLGGGSRVDFINVEGVIDNGVPFGSGIACDGVRKNDTPIAVVDIASNSSPAVLLGAEAQIVNLNSGTYSSTNGGGRPVTLRVVFQ